MKIKTTMKPKQIARPVLKGAKEMTPLQLNGVKFNHKRTLLTPETLEAIQAKNSRQPQQ